MKKFNNILVMILDDEVDALGNEYDSKSVKVPDKMLSVT